MVYPRIEIVKFKGKRRLNPKTGIYFKQGDRRKKDNWIFDHYNMGVILKNGFVGEQWRSLKKFNKKYKKKENLKEKVIKWLDNKKLRKGCQHCGYKKHAIALQFHHIDPSTKEGSISEMHKNTLARFKKIVKEIWKCIVLCANCHSIEEKKIRDNKKNNG